MINKEVKNAFEACKDIKSGMTLMLGVFGLCGIPQDLFEVKNFDGVINILSIEDKKKLDEILSLRNEKFFKNLHKILRQDN